MGIVVLNPPGESRGGNPDPGTPVKGSGISVPTSVATTRYEINGLVLNDRNAIETYWINKIDGLYDADIRDNREVRTDQDGEIFYGNLYSGKPITIDGFITARSYERWLDMKFALIDAFGDIRAETPFVARTGKADRDWMLFIAKTQPISLPDELSEGRFRTPFMISARASKPRIYSVLEETSTLNLGSSNTISLTNKGNREAFLRMRVWGGITGLFITNDASGKIWALKPTTNVEAGSYWDIDFEKNTMSALGGGNMFGNFDQSSDWPLTLLPELAQTLTAGYTSKTSTASINFYWRHTYR